MGERGDVEYMSAMDLQDNCEEMSGKKLTAAAVGTFRRGMYGDDPLIKTTRQFQLSCSKAGEMSGDVIGSEAAANAIIATTRDE